MWRDGWLGRNARRVAAQAVESGLQRLAESSRQGGLPGLDLVLPSGERIQFGNGADVILNVRDESMLATMAHPTIADLAQGFVEGRLDVDGSMLRAVAIAEQLAERGGAPVSVRVAAVTSKWPSGARTIAVTASLSISSAPLATFDSIAFRLASTGPLPSLSA